MQHTRRDTKTSQDMCHDAATLSFTRSDPSSFTRWAAALLLASDLRNRNQTTKLWTAPAPETQHQTALGKAGSCEVPLTAHTRLHRQESTDTAPHHGGSFSHHSDKQPERGSCRNKAGTCCAAEVWTMLIIKLQGV